MPRGAGGTEMGQDQAHNQGCTGGGGGGGVFAEGISKIKQEECGNTV